MKVIPIMAEAGISDFESSAACNGLMKLEGFIA
jgi:hypothetical protein